MEKTTQARWALQYIQMLFQRQIDRPSTTCRSSRPEVICKKGIFKNFTNFLRPETLLKKETLKQAFSCEFCEFFKNTYFYRTPLVAGSGHE